MQNSDHIYDIIAKLMMGSLTKEESNELDSWLAESPRHKQMLDNFLARKDMSRMFDIPTQHRDAARLFGEETANTSLTSHPGKTFLFVVRQNWSKLAVASVAALIVGMVWWNKYTEVIAPELPQEYVAAMSQSQQTGHSDADITIADADGEHSAKQLAQISDAKDASAIEELIERLKREGRIEEGNLQAQVVTHHDKEFWLTLPDGSRVHLNYGCQLTYPIVFTGDNREVTLEGEAYFFVAKDRRHPFIVHTKYGDVKEYGTEFNVNTSYISEQGSSVNAKKGVSVVLVNGSISVKPNGGKERMMKPNDMALLNGSSSAPSIQQVDTTPFVAWNTGTFAFDNCPMSQILAVIAKWYGVNVVTDNNLSEKMTFTGELDRYDTLENALHAISIVTGLEIKQDGKTILIENKGK